MLPADLPAITARTITDRDGLFAEIDAVRNRGWAFEREQGTEGVACVAVAVDYRIPATDAISCSMPAKLADADEVAKVSAALLRHTSLLASTLRREGIR